MRRCKCHPKSCYWCNRPQSLDYAAFVHRFQKHFQQGYEGPVREMPASIASLRKKLLLEELTELITAIDAGDPEEILDALVDMQYVLTGTILQQGMVNIFDEAFLRVHNANMNKVLVISRHKSKRDSVHDIVKPEGWVKPDLSDLVKPPRDSVAADPSAYPVDSVASDPSASLDPNRGRRR